MVEPTNWAEDRLSELDHHGVKGMKWGVRKDRYAERKATKQRINAPNERYSEVSRQHDRKHGVRGLEKRVNRRMNMDPKMTTETARSREKHREVQKWLGGIGGMGVGAAAGAVAAQASISTVINSTFSAKGEKFLTDNFGHDQALQLAMNIATVGSSKEGQKLIRIGGAHVGAILGAAGGNAYAAKRFDKKERQQYEEKNKKRG